MNKLGLELLLLFGLSLLSVLFVSCLVTTLLRGLILRGQRRNGYSPFSVQLHKSAVGMIFVWACAIGAFVELGIVPVFGRYPTPFNDIHAVMLIICAAACIGAIAKRPVAMSGINRPWRIDWHHRFGWAAVSSGLLAAIFGLLRAFYPLYRQ